ncbi:MAG: hypothetical protein II940_00865 [Methanosarcinaceae archaeon]|nr:hypothetical protein [Methanosarcinaceae archaeon]
MANAILAAVLSFFIPGLGQVYTKNYLRGIIFFIVVVFLAGIIAGFLSGLIGSLGWLFGLIPLLIWLYNIYDAYKLAA